MLMDCFAAGGEVADECAAGDAGHSAGQDD